jgi:hypothetical protein
MSRQAKGPEYEQCRAYPYPEPHSLYTGLSWSRSHPHAPSGTEGACDT